MRAIFLDRDGVICENRADYVKSWAEFDYLPGAKTSLANLSQLNLPIVVVTNQSAIGRGIITADIVEAIHHRMVEEISAAGGRIDKVIYCPSHPNDNSPCRKPEPGMLRQAAQELGLDLAHSYMVGDAASDLMAGQRVGCRTFLVLTGRGEAQLPLALNSVENSFTIAKDLAGVAEEIIKTETYLANLSGKSSILKTESDRNVR